MEFPPKIAVKIILLEDNYFYTAIYNAFIRAFFKLLAGWEVRRGA